MAAPHLPEHLAAAFLGSPLYVELPRGEHLYKFVSLPIVRERVLQSPWWIRQRTFDELRLRAQYLQRPLPEVIRSHLAIAIEWNPGMDTMWVIVLAASVGAWEGRARSQQASAGDAVVSFMGGGGQVCVPQLDGRQIAHEYTAHLTA